VAVNVLPEAPKQANPPRRSTHRRGESSAKIVLRRLVAAPLLLLGVSLVVFILVDLSPNDPARASLGIFATDEAREQFAEENGLNDPLPVRYWRFLTDAVQGDLGDSAVRSESVSELIAMALPVTAQLVAVAMTLAVVLALVLGIVAAWQEERFAGRAISAVLALIQAAPSFWVGLLFIQVFAVALGVLPSGGFTPIVEGFGPWMRSIMGPAIVLALGPCAALTIVIRAAVADELAKSYVYTAVGAGVPWPTVLARNVMRNALIPPITLLGTYIGVLLSGAVLIEFVFNVPGMGTLLMMGVGQGDLATVRGVAIVGAAAFIVANLIVDLLYIALNPRGLAAEAK
jgi:peptide/nickel transport system permease protein